MSFHMSFQEQVLSAPDERLRTLSGSRSNTRMGDECPDSEVVRVAPGHSR
jgi:hypothetical protein